MAAGGGANNCNFVSGKAELPGLRSNQTQSARSIHPHR